jgi:group II intron reverse transcriptase/maturase
LRRVSIPKAGSRELRPLGIPAVRDRVAQEVIRQLLDPIFEPLFHDASFGFRPARNCHQAIERLLQHKLDGYKFVVDADIKGFFDGISHDLIVAFVAAEVADGNILQIIEKFLKSGVMEDGALKPTPKGTPQGGVISPLLANIVLNHLDWQLQSKGLRFVRYADDFVVLCKSAAQAEEALTWVTHVIEGELGLQLHPQKTRLTRFSEGFEFLGFAFSGHTCTMRPKARENFKMKIRQLTRRSYNLDAQVILQLNRVIRGTVNYFATEFSSVRGVFCVFDKFIRRRLRCLKFKRISPVDNHRFRNHRFDRLGLLSAYALSARC